MKYVGWIITALVLYFIAAVSVRVAPTPGGWWHILLWVAILAGFVYLWRTRRKRKL